jgi:negative regulator of flagellin synthesis FlgM
MKINNGNGMQLHKLYQRQLEDKTKVNNKKSDQPASDSLSISNQSAKISELVKAAAVPAEVRAERVSELKEQIAQGKYTVDSKKLAEAMLGE